MDILFKIGAFLGFLAFLKVGELTFKVNQLMRNGRTQEGRVYTNHDHIRKEMLEPYIGSRIGLDFFEDEEGADLFMENDIRLLAVDEKWALLEIMNHGQKKQKLVRLSSVKGISVKKVDDNRFANSKIKRVLA